MNKYLILILGVICVCIFNPLQVLATESEQIEVVKKILNEACYCANAHNAQMWQVEINQDDKIILYLDKTRLLSEIDPNNKESLITMGAFIQNIVDVASFYDLIASVEVFAKTNADSKIAEISFSNGKRGLLDKKYKGKILNRHTDRNIFKQNAIDKNILQALVNTDAGNIKYFSLNSEQGHYISKSLIAANIKQANNDSKQAELAKWMRISWHDIISNSDGITPKMIGMPFPARVFIYTFFNKRLVMTRFFRDSGIDKVKTQVNNCAGFFVITSETTSSEDLIESGRLLQHFWISANDFGLSVQPMSQILEESPFKNEINSKIDIHKPISMILRVGYPIKKTTPSSNRRRVNKFIIK